MTIKFAKETEVTGAIWYKVYVDNTIVVAKRDGREARNIYLDMVKNAQNGLPHEETIEETTITPKS